MEDFGLGAEEAPEQSTEPQVEQVAQPEPPAEEPFGLGTEETPAEPEETPKEEAVKDEIPEKYSFEGEDEEFNTTVGGIAREIGLSQAKAQRMADAISSANMDFCLSQTKQWISEVKKDKELGGANFDKSIAAARSVFDRYADDGQLREILRHSGLSNHPALIRMLVRISKDLPQQQPRRSHFPNSNMGV